MLDCSDAECIENLINELSDPNLIAVNQAASTLTGAFDNDKDVLFSSGMHRYQSPKSIGPAALANESESHWFYKPLWSQSGLERSIQHRPVVDQLAKLPD